MTNRRVHVKFISICIITFVLMSPYVSKANADSHTAGGGYVDSWAVRNYGISIGKLSETYGDYGISFGYDTRADGTYSTAIGYKSHASGTDSIALGTENNASGGRSIAIGKYAQATMQDSIAIGTSNQYDNGTMATGKFSIAIGGDTRAQADNALALGTLAQAKGKGSVALGGTNTSANGENSTALGTKALAQSNSSTSVGYSAWATSNYATAVGAISEANGNGSTAIGNGAMANAAYSVALGTGSIASARDISTQDLYLGHNQNVAATLKGNAGVVSIGSIGYVSWGYEDLTRQLTGVAAGSNDTDAVNVAQLKGLGEAVSNVIGGGVSFDGGTGGVTVDGNPYDSLVDAIEELSSSGSVGNGVKEGNNIHVETDLTSGQQTVHLKNNIELESVTLNTAQTIQEGGKHAATTGHVHSLGSSVAGLFGGDFAVQTDGSISGGVFSVNGETFTTINDALNYLAGGWTFEPVDNSAQAGAEGGTGSAAETTPPQSSTILPGETLTVNAGNDIDITQNADKEYTISVAPDLRKEIEEGYAAADETLKADITEAYKQADSELKADITDAYTKADENLEADITKAYTEADTTLETKITEAYKAVDAELQAGIDKNAGTIKTIGDVLGGEANGYKAPSFNTVTTNSLKMGDYTVSATDGGLDMGRAKLTNIARGDVSAGSSDAVTGGQLWDTYQRMGTMENNIYREMDDLREDVNVVGAHAAALSGLHPIQYNPYEPTTLSAAVGTYRDEYAVAVGVFHYTRENVMFNLGASLCSDGDVMGRAGVSFAVGKSSDKKPRLASTMGGLQKQVIDMQAKLDGLEEKNARNEEIIRQNAEIMAQNEKLIRELTKRLEAKN